MQDSITAAPAGVYSLVRPVRTDGQTEAICHVSVTALPCANGHSHIGDAAPSQTCIHLLE